MSRANETEGVEVVTKKRTDMNKHVKLWVALIATSAFVACQQTDIVPPTPDNPDTPTAGRHLRFSGSVGSDKTTTRASWTDNNDGKLTFAWDYTLNPETATESEMKMAFVKEGNWLKSIEARVVVLSLPTLPLKRR